LRDRRLPTHNQRSGCNVRLHEGRRFLDTLLWGFGRAGPRRRRFMEHTQALRERIEVLAAQGADDAEIRDVFWMWRSTPTQRNDLYRELGLRLEAAPGGDLQATFDFDPEKSIPEALLDTKRAALQHNAVVSDDSHSQG
jgi:hypothetical protein